MTRLPSFIAAILLTIPAWGEPDAPAFGDWLMAQQRYRDAALVFERDAFDHRNEKGLDLRLEKTLAAASATGDAAYLLKLARAWDSQAGNGCWPDLYAAHALYRLRNPEAVATSPAKQDCPPDTAAEIGYLRGLSLLRLRRFPDAEATLASINAQGRLAPKVAAARAAIAQAPALKSPGLASGLNALLPGAGYFYARRPQTAFAALTITGLTTWGAWSAARAGNPGLAALASLFSFGWYMGGVYGGARAADHENNRQVQLWIGPLEIER